MRIEDRISRWRDETPGEETEGHIELLCDAETELRRLRRLDELSRARDKRTERRAAR